MRSLSHVKPEAKDLIALLTIAGGFLLIARGIDGIVGALLVAVVSGYFGHHVAMLHGGERTGRRRQRSTRRRRS